jgi:hypothetical protein
MRVAKVTFSQQVKIGGKFVTEAQGDDIEFIPDAQVIRIGRQNIPIGKVNDFHEMERGWPCKMVDKDTGLRCQYAATDPRGLGAHQRHKHGIAGTSPGREGARQ